MLIISILTVYIRCKELVEVININTITGKLYANNYDDSHLYTYIVKDDCCMLLWNNFNTLCMSLIIEGTYIRKICVTSMSWNENTGTRFTKAV